MDTDLKTQNLGFINDNNPASLYNIKHDLTKKHDLYDNSVDIYQSEDVFEHIEYDELLPAINDIYRILKPNGLFRLSIPDYNQKLITDRCLKKNGVIYFDPNGGGEYKDGKRHGQGTLKNADGDEFIGEFKDGKPHGKGTWINANGFTQILEFKDGKVFVDGKLITDGELVQ